MKTEQLVVPPMLATKWLAVQPQPYEQNGFRYKLSPNAKFVYVQNQKSGWDIGFYNGNHQKPRFTFLHKNTSEAFDRGYLKGYRSPVLPQDELERTEDHNDIESYGFMCGYVDKHLCTLADEDASDYTSCNHCGTIGPRESMHSAHVEGCTSEWCTCDAYVCYSCCSDCK